MFGNHQKFTVKEREVLWKTQQLTVVERGKGWQILRPTEPVKPLDEQLKEFFRRKNKWE